MNRDAKHNLEAIALVCTAYAFFSFSDTMAKYLTSFYPIHIILAISSFFGAFITGTWIVTRHGIKGFHSPNLKIHLARGLSTAALIQCAIRAYEILPLAEFYGISFTSPLMVLLFSRFLLHEHVSWQGLSAVLIGFTGMLVITGPVYNTMSLGIVFTLGAMIFVSLNILCLRKMQRQDHLPIYSFYPFTMIFLTNVPFALYNFELPSNTHLLMFAPYVAILICAQICNGLGYRRAHVTAVVAPFHYTQIVWGVILGYLIFGDVPLPTTLLGSAMIIGAGLFVIRQQYREAKADRAVPVRS